MIKRIRLVTRQKSVPELEFAASFPDALAAVSGASPEVRPGRVTACIVLPAAGEAKPAHDGIGFQWFTDMAHLARYDKWCASTAGRRAAEALGGLVDAGASPTVVADEVVVRGADWLGRRWEQGGPRFKHLALARRAPGLTPAEFSERWRGRAGQLRTRGGGDRVQAIPDEVRGNAYVQNHSLPGGTWAYDAINEVYFDDLASLATRVDWFRHNLPERPEPDLFDQAWTVAAHELVLC